MCVRPRVQHIPVAIRVPNRRSIACHFLSRLTFGRKQIFDLLAQVVNFEPRCCAQSDNIPVIATRKERWTGQAHVSTLTVSRLGRRRARRWSNGWREARFFPMRSWRRSSSAPMVSHSLSKTMVRGGALSALGGGTHHQFGSSRCRTKNHHLREFGVVRFSTFSTASTRPGHR